MAEAERPDRLSPAHRVTVEDVRALMGPSTPHFAMHLRNRIAKLIRGLPADHPARIEGEREIARLERLGFTGETRGEQGEPGEQPLRSVDADAAPVRHARPSRRPYRVG